jgi:transcriptional regulator with GAF, ATPase, and Fis domain
MAALAAVRCAQRADESRRFQQIVGNSPALESVLEQVQLVGPTDSTVLLLGEGPDSRSDESALPRARI